MILRRLPLQRHGAGCTVLRPQRRWKADVSIATPTHSSGSSQPDPEIFENIDDVPISKARSAGTKRVQRPRSLQEPRAYRRTDSEQRADEDRARRRGQPAPVLRFERASKSLTLTDFRRVIPKGKHIEGFGLAKFDIVKVIPGRHPWTLEAFPWYYLVFSTPAAAQTYRAYAANLHALASQLANGNHMYGDPLEKIKRWDLNLDDVLAAYAVMSPGLGTSINQLHYPLTPASEATIEAGDVPALVNRPGRKPFELRMTLTGPAVALKELRQSLVNTGVERNLPWSGDFLNHLHLSLWEPRMAGNASSQSTEQSTPVYIVGFDTEDAAESFLHYWQNRRLQIGQRKLYESYPPSINLEALYVLS